MKSHTFTSLLNIFPKFNLNQSELQLYREKDGSGRERILEHGDRKVKDCSNDGGRAPLIVV
jgi:hypothetical protein